MLPALRTLNWNTATLSHIPGPLFKPLTMPQDNTLKGSREHPELGAGAWCRSKDADGAAAPAAHSDVGAPQLLNKSGIQLYPIRWLMLSLFSAVSASNASMWIQYGIISNIFTRFYNTDSLAVDWLTMIYLFTYIPLIVPVLWLLNRRGVRDVVLVGAAFNCIGAWIRVGSAAPDMFSVAVLGQFVSSVASVFVLGIPSYLASVWFGEKEVSTACSIGVVGNQVRWIQGCAGFRKSVRMRKSGGD